MRKFLAPLAGASLIVLAPAAASAQPTAITPPPSPPPVVYMAPPRVPGRPPVPARVVSLAPATTPVDPVALALAHQILDIGFPAEKRSQMFASVMDSLNGQARKAMENLGFTTDKDLQALMNRSSQRMWDEMKPILNAALPDIFDSIARA